MTNLLAIKYFCFDFFFIQLRHCSPWSDLSRALYKLFIRTRMRGNGEKMIFFLPINLWFTNIHVFYLRSIIFSNPVEYYVSIPEAQEAGILGCTRRKDIIYKSTKINQWCSWYFIFAKTNAMVSYSFSF